MSLAHSFRRRVRGRVTVGPPPPPPPYHPTQEAGIWAYYEGHINGSSQWPDATGNGRHGVQGTVDNLPSNGTDSLSRDAIVFDGTKWLTFPNWNSFTQGAVYIALQAASDPPASLATSSPWQFGTSNESSTYPSYYGGSLIYDDIGSSARRLIGNPTTLLGVATSLADPHVYSVKSTPTLWEVRLDGQLLYSDNSAMEDFPGVAFPGYLYPPTLGVGSSVEYKWAGKVAALAVFSTPPADDSELLAYMMGA